MMGNYTTEDRTSDTRLRSTESCVATPNPEPRRSPWFEVRSRRRSRRAPGHRQKRPALRPFWTGLSRDLLSANPVAAWGRGRENRQVTVVQQAWSFFGFRRRGSYDAALL